MMQQLQSANVQRLTSILVSQAVMKMSESAWACAAVHRSTAHFVEDEGRARAAVADPCRPSGLQAAD